jgi:CheY-like chemotaxis protein
LGEGIVPKCVLVVEDDPVLRMDAATMLEEAGLDVVQLETGDSALAYVLEQSEAVGAVFSDVQMPGDTDGLDLAAYIATNWPGITIVLTSGHVHPTRDLPGNIKFVSKPWVPEEVLAALTGAL